MSETRRRVLYRSLMAFVLLAWRDHACADDAVRAFIAKADAYRQPIEEGVLVFSSITHREGEPVAKATYQVSVKGPQLSLVQSLDGPDRGQRVLMNEDNLWVRLPGSSRAVRITPMQKLMGDVSYGDLGKLRWAADYSAERLDTGGEAVEGVAVRKFKLTAVDLAATYSVIELWLADDDSRPLLAKFYLGSGKLLKIATFSALATIDGKRVVKSTTYRDQLNLKSYSVLHLESARPQSFSEAVFSVQRFRQ